MPENWSEEEDLITVEAYLDMLCFELNGKAYNKAAVRREILPKLNNRSNGSLEFKNQNISSVLISLSCPFIDGYKPLSNYQILLATTVGKALERRPEVLELMDQFVRSEITKPSIPDILTILDDQPPIADLSNQLVADSRPNYNPRRTNFLEVEALNRKIGLSGEEIALEFEKQRLISAGKDNLADRIEHVSVEQGDGAGFDIRSFKANGSDLFIEVKATRMRKENPFFISSNEVNFSREHSENYSLYRIYQISKAPRLFSLSGDITNFCSLTPTQYQASF